MASEVRIHWDRNDKGKDDDDKKTLLFKKSVQGPSATPSRVTVHHISLTLQANPQAKNKSMKSSYIKTAHTT